MRWTDILGRDVIDTTTAESVGSIDGLVADPATSSVAAIVVGGRTISWSDSAGIGVDALTLRHADLLGEPSSDLERSTLEGAGDPLGKRMITEDGVAIGTLDDLEVDPESGDIGRLHFDDDDIKGSRLVGIGSYAVVISSPGRTPTSGSVATGADELAGLSKAELYEIAQDRDLSGRSTMSKQQLVDSLS